MGTEASKTTKGQVTTEEQVTTEKDFTTEEQFTTEMAETTEKEFTTEASETTPEEISELKEKTTEAAQTTSAPVNFEMSIKELTERDATITIVTSDLVVDMNLYFYVPTSDEPNVFNINVIRRTNVVRLSPLPRGTSFRIVGEAKLRDGTKMFEELEFTTLGEKLEATTWFAPTTEQETTEREQTTEREETTEREKKTEREETSEEQI